MREQLKSRTPEEKEYGRRLELRYDVAVENLQRYEEYENHFT